LSMMRINKNILGGISTNTNYIINLFTYYEPWVIVGLICSVAVCIFAKKSWSKMKLMVVFLIICLCLFSVFFISSTKLLYYFIPIYPFVAIFIALSLNTLLLFIEIYYIKYRDFFNVTASSIIFPIWK